LSFGKTTGNFSFKIEDNEVKEDVTIPFPVYASAGTQFTGEENQAGSYYHRFPSLLLQVA